MQLGHYYLLDFYSLTVILTRKKLSFCDLRKLSNLRQNILRKMFMQQT